MCSVNMTISTLLSKYDQDTPPDAWEVVPLQFGMQAKTFSAYNRNVRLHKDAPSCVVVKLFNQERIDVLTALNDEYESLSLMGRSFQDFLIDDWKISAPRPLFITRNPPALVMSYVRGIPLDILLGDTDNNTQNVLSTLYKPIALSLQKYWSEHSRIIGDLNFNNILCDLPSKTLAFIDPGMPYLSFNCKDVPRVFSPPSHDLGYLLFEVCATNTKLYIFSLGKVRRRSYFVEQLIHCYMRYFVKETHFESFLNELHECSKFHVGRIELSWGLRGAWRYYVAKMTLLSLSRKIADIRKQLGGSNNVGNYHML